MKKMIAAILSLTMLLSVCGGMGITVFADCAHTSYHYENVKDATTTETGYTGDKVCDDCGEIIEPGTDIPMLPSGWVTEDGKTYYYDAEGVAVTGWQNIDGKRYYFGADGVMLRYARTIDGKKYYFNSKGEMFTGWLNISGKKYYFGADGAAVKYRHTIDGKLYYFNGNAEMYKGWLTIGGKKFYFGSDGAAVKYRQSIGGNFYYFSGNGEMYKGWLTISGKRYYFGDKGAVKYKQTIGGKIYYFNSKGEMYKGWLTIGGKRFYFGSDGSAVKYRQTIGGHEYYFNGKGEMFTGWLNINGAWSYYNENGVKSTGYVNVYASYTSPYSNNANRTNNLRVSSAAINGTILKPGDTFDFNKVVGWRTAARGYKEAPVFLGPTEHGLGLGGGVCQTSSTVFNAALLANLQIVERHQHSQKVYYVPFGRDAAISGSEKNMRFRNNTPYNIKIEMKVSGGYITCTLLTQERVSPAKVSVDVSKSGSTYTLRRYANGSNNYTTRSTY